MQTVYSRLTRYDMTVEYTVYPSLTAKKAIQTELSNVQRDGISAHSRLSTLETLVSPLYSLRINHQSKTIMLSKTVSHNLSDLLRNTWQDLFKQATAFAPLPATENGITGFKIPLNNPSVSEMEIYINNETHLLSSCVLYYRETFSFDAAKKDEPKAPKVVMTYKNINTNPTFAPAFFSIDKYVTAKNGKWQLSPAYKNWRLDVNLGR
jgi:Txe/YoeB family toxin of Txe-Axe toxin-antitoxin module